MTDQSIPFDTTTGTGLHLHQKNELHSRASVELPGSPNSSIAMPPEEGEELHSLIQHFLQIHKPMPQQCNNVNTNPNTYCSEKSTERRKAQEYINYMLLAIADQKSNSICVDYLRRGIQKQAWAIALYLFFSTEVIRSLGS